MSCLASRLIGICLFATLISPHSGIAQVSKATPTHDPFWLLQKSPRQESFRGLCVVSDTVAWASGTGGSVIRTTDGKTWTDVSIKSESKMDFRDIHAFDANRAVVVSAGSPGRIYYTDDGGENWEKVYEDLREEIFFDAMAFLNNGLGIVFGDPIEGKGQLVHTNDGGKSWRKAPDEFLPAMHEGEAGFAASGTCLIMEPSGRIILVTGGATMGKKFARFMSLHPNPMFTAKWKSVDTPIQRNESSGIFSIAMHHEIAVVVGGDYKQPEKAENHIAVSNDSGKTWNAVTESVPRGYRSGIAVAKQKDHLLWVTVGPSGTDTSNAPAKKWKSVDRGAFHAVAFSPGGNTAWATGPDGRIGKWTAK